MEKLLRVCSYSWHPNLFNGTRFYVKSIQACSSWYYGLLLPWALCCFRNIPATLVSTAEAACYILQQLTIMIVISNTHCYLVLPYLKQRKIAIGLFLYVLLYPALSLLLPHLCEALAQLFGLLFGIQQKAEWRAQDMPMNVFINTVIASAFNMARDRFLLEQENKEAELKQLKEQLNPHFLFNTLNNLYGMAVLKSDELPAMMLKLSELLRYSLYETNQTLVPLEKEVRYLQNYLDLERIRLGARTTVCLTVRGNISSRQIAPMVLIVFVENSIKHHSAKRNKQGFVTIQLDLNGDKLRLRVKNSLDSSYQPPASGLAVGGIGLSNVRKRLDLMYPNSYTLTLHPEPEMYQMELNLQLRQ